MNTSIAFIGGGNMARSIIGGLLKQGVDKSRLHVSEPYEPTRTALADELSLQVVNDNVQVALAGQVWLFAVKPQVMKAVCAELKETAQANKPLIISIAAGITATQLDDWLGGGLPVVRVMPNTPALVGMGMSVMSPAPGCPPESLALAQRVLGAVGEVRTAPEAQQDAVTAVSGSGPAYVFYVAEAMIDAGVMLGLPRPLAHDLTVQTLLGAATMMRDTGEHPTVLRENVTSPGGTTAAALHVLDDAAVKAAFGNAMRACRDRSAELGQS